VLANALVEDSSASAAAVLIIFFISTFLGSCWFELLAETGQRRPTNKFSLSLE
jgi:hypothetical protein